MTRSAEKMLSLRDQPLLVEIALVFACVLRKQVYFHEVIQCANTIPINANLALVLTTRIPDSCEANHSDKVLEKVSMRGFTPKWLRVDYIKNEWVGECGL